MVAGEVGDAHSADEIGRAVHAWIGREDFSRAAKIVYEHHGFRTLGAEVVADGGTLPINPVVAGVFGIERAFAIAEARNEGATGLLAEDVTIRSAGALEGVLH